MRILALALAFVALTASAQTLPRDSARVSWVLPTLNVDGSTIPATGPGSLRDVRVRRGTCVGTAFGTQAEVVTLPATALEYTFNLLPDGPNCFQVRVSNVDDQFSDWAGPAIKTITPALKKPGKPTNVTAQ